MDATVKAIFNHEIIPNEWHGVAVRTCHDGSEVRVHYFKNDEIGTEYLGEGHQGSYFRGPDALVDAMVEFNRRVSRLLASKRIAEHA